MIHRTQVTFTAYGEQFTPSKVSAPFTDAHDPGAIENTHLIVSFYSFQIETYDVQRITISRASPHSLLLRL